jgi:hypothetical protein
MTSPLSDFAMFRDLDEYSVLTHLTFWAGGPGGGGSSQALGYGYGQSARDPENDWVGVHELLHTFDYAGNPLHTKRGGFDRRGQGNPYVFFHEGPAVAEQAMAPRAHTLWGYRTDAWPCWEPLDVGLIELGYDAFIFWSYLLNTYPTGPRLTWEGPPICACATNARPNGPPLNFGLFELWNAQVRSRIRLDLGPDTPLADYACTDNLPSGDDEFFIYNGHVQPACHQTLEYELAVLEDIIRERFDANGTPLAESLLLDFAVQFAEAFPPLSLTRGMPSAVSSSNMAGLYFSHGFADDGWPDSFVRLDNPRANTNDFYARIHFRIRDVSLRYLRLTANDDATLYVAGRAVIEGPGDSFPEASTTYADQRRDDGAGLDYVYAGTARPASSVVAIDDPTQSEFEIEWVNRGDGKGNGDTTDRYFLTLEGRGSGLDPLLAPIPADQIEILSADFWPKQGSGEPGFISAPSPKGMAAPILDQEIQLRPVSSGQRPFFLPPLGVHYHPVGSPTGCAGAFNVTVRHDGLTHTRPSAHLLVLTNNGIQWRGPLEQVDHDTQRAILQSCGDGSPATYEGNPALILVVARRTLHGETNGPAQYGTLGALHYTVGISQPSIPVEADRHDDPNQLGDPPNNTFADATHLPHIAGGDIFTGPGPGPDRLWNMLVPDLTLHNRADQDFFRLDLPDEAGDDCLDVLPECGNAARVGNGILEITVRGTGGTEIIAYDAQGNELARDDNYLRVGCPRESGLDPFYFSVSSRSGCRIAYFLEICYEVPDAGLWERFGHLCIPGGGGGGDDFDMDDFFRHIAPLQVAWQVYIFGIDCNPIVCNPPKHDYLFFHWDFAGPLELEFQHDASLDFDFALLDEHFNKMGSATRGGSARSAKQAAATESLVTRRLIVTYLPAGYYVLRVNGSQFGVPYSMRVLGLPGTELRIDPASAAFTGGEIRFSWQAEPGRRYRVQFKDRLTDHSWIDSGQEIRATSPLATFREATPAAPARFYRILRLDL